jgi:hypothetical protein
MEVRSAFLPEQQSLRLPSLLCNGENQDVVCDQIVWV